MRASLRPFVLGSAVLILLACACALPPEVVGPDAATSPVDSVECTGQEAQTVAGDDADTTEEPDGCTETTASDSGDGDFAFVSISDLGDGVFAIDMESGETGGDDEDPTARVEVEFTIAFEGGGEWLVFSAFDASTGEPAFVVGECTSGAATVPVVFRGSVPTSPEGGSITCTVTAETPGAGIYRVLAGANLARDGDGDGVSNANDRYCPNSVGAVDASGCALHGTYPPNVAWFCNTAPPAGVCAFNPPAPGFCQDCTVVVDEVVVAAPGPGHVTVQAGSQVICQNCEIEEGGVGWLLSCGSAAECSRLPSGALGVDQGGGDFALSLALLAIFGDEGASDQVVVDPDALASDDPNVVTIEVATTDPGDDLVAEFELTTGGRSYTRTIETFGGVGQSRIRLVFDAVAEITWPSIPGWEFQSHDCPGEGATAEVDGSADCLFRLTRLDVGDVIPLPQTGIEIANEVSTNFGDLGLGELFSVSGANGVGVYRADTFSLVPSLSEIGGFNLINVLGALLLDAPGFPNDGRFAYRTPFGTAISQYFPTIPGFGASLVSNVGVTDANYVDGNPGLGRGVITTASGISALSFQDFGGDHPFLTSNPVVFEAPPGYSFTSAFQTSESSNVLVAARNATEGENGRLFLATGSTTTETIGDLGEDPRVLRCASAVAGTWICVAANYESSNVSVATWDGGPTAAVVGTLATGPNPLVPGIAAAGGEVRVLIPSFTGDSATAVRLDGATGTEIARRSHALPPGAFASSALILEDASTSVVTLSGSDEIQVIRGTFGF